MRGLILLLPLAWLASCGGNDCECDECDEAIDLCEKDDTACIDASVALCDAGTGDTAAR
jgi:hypothetical protein